MGHAKVFAAAHRCSHYPCWHGLSGHVQQTSGSVWQTRSGSLAPAESKPGQSQVHQRNARRLGNPIAVRG